MYPKARLDALTDCSFAVARALVVLELRVPDQPVPDSAALWQALKDLWPKFFPYLLSFLVLGNSWLSKIRVRNGGRTCDPHLCDLLAPKPAACHLRAVLDHAGRALCRCAARDLDLCRQSRTERRDRARHGDVHARSTSSQRRAARRRHGF